MKCTKPAAAPPSYAVRQRLRLLPLIVLAFMLAGCSIFGPKPQVRGNLVDPDVLKELVPGTSTRADVTALLGSPTSKATFDDNTWIYIGETTETQVASTQEIVNQQVVLVSFNDAGVLQKIRRLDQDDSVPVDIVSRTTPSPGSEATILQQLFGSIGRFNPFGGQLNDTSNANTR